MLTIEIEDMFVSRCRGNSRSSHVLNRELFNLRSRRRRTQGTPPISTPYSSRLKRLTRKSTALHPKPLPLRQTLPRNKISLLRHNHIPLLPPLLPRSPNQKLKTPSRRFLLQRKTLLGQQQLSLHPHLPPLAKTRFRPNPHGRLLRTSKTRRPPRRSRKAIVRTRKTGVYTVLVGRDSAEYSESAVEEDGDCAADL